jgi:hypothetical protein
MAKKVDALTIVKENKKKHPEDACCCIAANSRDSQGEQKGSFRKCLYLLLQISAIVTTGCRGA